MCPPTRHSRRRPSTQGIPLHTVWRDSTPAADAATAQATVKLANKLRLLAFAAGDADSPGLEVTGDANALPSILAVLDRPDPGFNIVTP